jgi:hypothetical protein
VERPPSAAASQPDVAVEADLAEPTAPEAICAAVIGESQDPKGRVCGTLIPHSFPVPRGTRAPASDDPCYHTDRGKGALLLVFGCRVTAQATSVLGNGLHTIL